MKRIAYIPARGGSKGLPGKNIRPLLGRPLISYTIAAALEAGCFKRVFVSTDSAEIAEIARRSGAWVPFLRNAMFAQDTTLIMDAIMDDMHRLREINETFDTFCLLQPTSPLRSAADIRRAVELCERYSEGVVGISPVREHPLLMRTMSGDGRLSHVMQLPTSARRQDMEPVYRINGAIYCVPVEDLRPGTVLADGARGIVMSEDDSVDIDDLDDFRLAEDMMRMRQEKADARRS